MPDRTPSKQEYAPVPVWVYNGVLHTGMHDCPLARLDVQLPQAPFAGAEIAHGLGPHKAVLVVSVPKVQILVPEIIYPLLHVGVHELPLARLPVHGVASPLVGTAAASHGLHKELH
jgi:hypothetical protein